MDSYFLLKKKIVLPQETALPFGLNVYPQSNFIWNGLTFGLATASSLSVGGRTRR